VNSTDDAQPVATPPSDPDAQPADPAGAPAQPAAPNEPAPAEGNMPAAPLATRAPISPGEPIVLVDELWFPARIVLHDDFLYFADRPRLGDPTAVDTLVRIPIGQADPTPETLFQAGSIDGLTVFDRTVWVSSAVDRSFIAFDIAQGVEVERREAPTSAAYSVSHNSTSVFLGASEGLVLQLSRATGDATVLHTGEMNDVPQWFRATEEALYISMDGYNVEQSATVSRLMRVPFDGSGATTLLDRQTRIGGFEILGNLLYFVDYGQGTFESITITGGVATLIAQIENPWGLLIEGETAYITTQPDFCTDGPEGDLQRIDLATGSALLLAEGLTCPSMMVGTDDALYWVNNGTADVDAGFIAHRDGSLMMLPR
jgi:hypothetical protein